MRVFLFILFLGAVGIAVGSLYSSHKMERCVSDMLRAHQRSIAPWEAAQRCQNPKE